MSPKTLEFPGGMQSRDHHLEYRNFKMYRVLEVEMSQILINTTCMPGKCVDLPIWKRRPKA
jgi:hypothetical protein